MTTEDTLLQELRDAVDPTISKIDEDFETDRAVLLISAADPTDSNGESLGLQTYFDCTGDHGIIQEALYNILTQKIDEGSPELFQAIRDVIREIESDKEIDPDEDFEAGRVYH